MSLFLQFFGGGQPGQPRLTGNGEAERGEGPPVEARTAASVRGAPAPHTDAPACVVFASLGRFHWVKVWTVLRSVQRVHVVGMRAERGLTPSRSKEDLP